MTCEMCHAYGRAAAEIRDDSFAQRVIAANAEAEISEAGDLVIRTDLKAEHGARLNIFVPMRFCPWCGAELTDGSEWEE